MNATHYITAHLCSCLATSTLHGVISSHLCEQAAHQGDSWGGRASSVTARSAAKRISTIGLRLFTLLRWIASLQGPLLIFDPLFSTHCSVPEQNVSWSQFTCRTAHMAGRLRGKNRFYLQILLGQIVKRVFLFEVGSSELIFF